MHHGLATLHVSVDLRNMHDFNMLGPSTWKVLAASLIATLKSLHIDEDPAQVASPLWNLLSFLWIELAFSVLVSHRTLAYPSYSTDQMNCNTILCICRFN